MRIAHIAWRFLALVLVALSARCSVVTTVLPGYPGPPESTPLSFIAFGDMADGSAAQVQLAGVMRTRAPLYTLALTTGDNAYPAGAPADFQAKFFGVYQGIFQAAATAPPAPTTGLPKPVYATPGNHDWMTSGAAGFAGGFVMPENGPAGVPAESFYTFDVDGVHFVAFDSMFAINLASTAQKTAIRDWLLADLDARVNAVTVVFDHHPAFTAGPHMNEFEMQKMQSDWFPLFAAHGVDLLLSGHDHFYERNTPQQGLTSYVTGAGGGSLYAITPQSWTAAYLNTASSYLEVTVDGCLVSTIVVTKANTTFDSWSFTAPTCGQ